MRGIRRFWADRRGGMVERIAVMAGAVALASMTGAHFLDVASRDPGSPLYAWFGKRQPIDYTTTATIRKQAGQITLDPCTGKTK